MCQTSKNEDKRSSSYTISILFVKFRNFIFYLSSKEIFREQALLSKKSIRENFNAKGKKRYIRIFTFELV